MPIKRLVLVQDKWGEFMKESRRWSLRSIGGKIMMVLVLAAMIGSIDTVSASAKDKNDHKGKNDNSRYENRGRGHDRYVQRRPVYREYGYRERAYVPPPVIYVPPPPPGIGIFFPPIFFNH
jgi:hypothetical protein